MIFRQRKSMTLIVVVLILFFALCTRTSFPTIKITTLQAVKFPTHTISSRTLIIVRTAYKCRSRLKYLLQSWIPSTLEQKLKHIYLFTDNYFNDASYSNFSNVIITNCPGSHDLTDLCCKTAHEFELYYNLSIGESKFDWMCRFDDDQYVNLDNLYNYLKNLDPSIPFYIGATHTEGIQQVPEDRSRTFSYAIYGAGVCYSKELLRKMKILVNKRTMPNMCLKFNFVDDICLGYICVVKLNVSLTVMNDYLHAHVETVAQTFHHWNLDQLSKMIALGFSPYQYPIDKMVMVHQLYNYSDTR